MGQNQVVTDQAYHDAAVAIREHLQIIDHPTQAHNVTVAQANLDAYDGLAVIA